jgi:2-polyprenyl-3-methyl-5-hydroxy-6-metoxy-1,4-benzoquinol methylase/glycosyltransferase involved in cell wall biosynthesis
VTCTIAFFVDSVDFTPSVISGQASLGGSESACLGLARALAARGHRVHLFATKLEDGCAGYDHAGVRWHHAETLLDVSRVIEWDVFCSLRMPAPFHASIRARLRLLWNQDLLTTEAAKNAIMGVAWAIDRFVYVSEFHRVQWQDWLPEIAPHGWATKNGFDPALVPNLKDVHKHPHRIIHISRPERGLAPLLAMWPALKAQYPQAELKLCRYNSMYDATGWGKVCSMFDKEVERVNAEVGGIEYLGELGKPALYQAIAESAVMWYPGVVDFAETSCIAAIEAQANGTPFVGSYKGALPETVPYGFLIDGDATSEAYQQLSIDAVIDQLKGCASNSFAYRSTVAKGLEHVKDYTYDAIAAEWEAFIWRTFRARYEAYTPAVLAQLLHHDDHMAARIVAEELGDQAAIAKCESMFGGGDHTPDQYAARALDPRIEIAHPENGRLQAVVKRLQGCEHVLDVACGNGAFAIALALSNPAMRVTGIDYSEKNIDVAEQAAKELGVGDRITFLCAPVWDFATRGLSDWWQGFSQSAGKVYDGLWVGEFIEHVTDCTGLVDGLETVLEAGAQVVYTCPSGPLGEYQPRTEEHRTGHVHHFAADDVAAVFGAKQGIDVELLSWKGKSPAGSDCGNWLIAYTVDHARKAGQRDYAHRILTCRPRLRLSVGILALNAEHDILRCIDSIWAVADEILVGDTGCSDTTRQIVEGIRKVRVIDVQPVNKQADGFAGARNDVLAAARGEWFMWIDTDEIVAGSYGLRTYLESDVYQGYALFQNHLYLDLPKSADTPVRIFRRRSDIQFYGCVHEQPQMGDCNGDIIPALQINDVQLAHTGYLVEGIRRQKMTERNFPLLIKDKERFPDRRLGKVLILRDLVNLADYAAESYRGQYPTHAIEYLKRAVALFEAEFKDPADKFHAIARPWYERALKAFGIGYEAEMAFTAKQGGLNGERAKVQRLWVRDPADLKRLIEWQADQMMKGVIQPDIRVEPLEMREAVSA